MGLATEVSTGLGRKRGCWRPVLTGASFPPALCLVTASSWKTLSVWVISAVLVATEDPLMSDSVPGGMCSWMCWWDYEVIWQSLSNGRFLPLHTIAPVWMSTAPCWTPWRPQGEDPASIWNRAELRAEGKRVELHGGCYSFVCTWLISSAHIPLLEKGT